MIKKGRIWLCMSVLLGFWACSDDAENPVVPVTAEDVENVTSVDEATVTFADAVTISNEILSDEEVIAGRKQQQCYSVSETETENQLLVSFETNCEGEDGKVRSGSFLIAWAGTFGEGDFSYSLTFDGYKVNDFGLGGSITVSDIAFIEDGFTFNVAVNDGVVNCPDGKQINYEQDLTYDFTLDEVLEIRITGSSNGTGKEGVSYVANIKEPLLLVAGCDHVVSGSFEATFNGRPMVTVDYGDGTCENMAVARRGDQSLDFEL